MNKTSSVISVLAGLGAGAAIMYFADPERGHRRRSIARDKVKSSAHGLSRWASKARRDLANRAYGMWARSRRLLENQFVDDQIVEQRVRARMGHVVSYPHAIRVAAEDGKVTLTGAILTDEIGDLLRCVRTVPGVRFVENLLECQVPIARREPESKNAGGTRAFLRPPVIH